MQRVCLSPQVQFQKCIYGVRNCLRLRHTLRTYIVHIVLINQGSLAAMFFLMQDCFFFFPLGQFVELTSKSMRNCPEAVVGIDASHIRMHIRTY